MRLHFEVHRRILALNLTHVIATLCLIGILSLIIKRTISQVKANTLQRASENTSGIMSEEIISQLRRIETASVDKHTVETFLVRSFKMNSTFHELQNPRSVRWPAIQTAKYPVGSHYADGTPVPKTEPLQPMISIGQRALLFRMVKLVIDLMFASGLGDRFFLDGGSALGSFGHHNMIPWDDDVDFMVEARITRKLYTLLKSLRPEFCIFSWYKLDRLHKPFDPNQNDLSDEEIGQKVLRFPWAYPFIELFSYTRNATHFMHLGPPFHVIPINVVSIDLSSVWIGLVACSN